MNKSCARCQKVVYPIEELKCLDKTWHKTCFKCHECGMTLNMKTYKGFNKLPYCEAHIPKAKATTIAETPEFKRIAENTKIQSNVKYHADFEKLKGKVTQVADDPETLRIKQNTKNISNVAYHGDLQKKAAMERQRECTEIIDSKDNNDLESEYFSEQLAAESLPHYQPPPPPPVVAPAASSQQVNNNGGMAVGPTNTATQQAQIISTANITKHNQANSYQASLQQQQQQQQQYQQMNNNNKSGGGYPHAQQQGGYAAGGTTAYHQHATNANGAGGSIGNAEHVRHSVLQNSATPSGGGGGGAATQKYYDPYDNYARPNPAANQVNNNGTTGAHMGNNNHHYHHSQQQQHQQQHLHHHQQHHGGGGMMDQQRANGSAAAAYHQQQQQQQHMHHGQANNHQHHHQQSAGMVDPYAQQQQQQQRYSANSNSQYGGAMHAQQQQQQQHMYQYNNGNMNNGAASVAAATAGAGSIGKIADYDPLTDGPRNVPQPNRQSATLIYSSGNMSSNNNRRIGSVNDIDPVNGYYGSVADNSQAALYQQQQQQQQQLYQQQQQHRQSQQQQPQYIQPPQQYAAPASNASGKSMSKVRVYRALYDYEAQDSDEVGFSEGDLIIEVNSIDAGWMTGRVERTGLTGMLPANYVELMKI
ncbi:LIM and SH3 domain protein Lasp isoform X1 [Anopheles maculipalpis]|uniref:LIM and SH3 domain protein Lasp isoform X1 n=1 Tax=Anopheles maculipalpis TaxID=1496333 RepID=UPI002159A431|nr:LIM and SH3 domain protein Lasp isoform X1 [Anopheles maculipalpis]